MSRHALFVFIEGREDRFFFSRLTEDVKVGLPIEPALVVADEIPGNGSGKERLEQFYSYLIARKRLDSVFEGKRSIALFIADKDLDDFRRRRRRTRYFVYTATYDLDNLLFRCGDLVVAVAAAAGLDLGTVRSHLGQGDWPEQAAKEWIDWVTICFAATTRGWRGQA